MVDLGLLRRREIDEIGGIADNADDEVAVFFRVFPRGDKRRLVDDVELHAPVLEFRPGGDDLHQPTPSLFAGDVGRAGIQIDEIAALLAETAVATSRYRGEDVAKLLETPM
jgi:hypothetical protein